MLRDAYAEPLASHGEIAVFRQAKKQEIENKHARLSVIGALQVLEDDLNNKIIRPEIFSKYVFSIMMGNGFKNGVSTSVKETYAERVIIERIVKRAASYLNGPAQNGPVFQQNQIWASQPNPAHAQHVGVLNRLVAGEAKAAPPYCFNYEPSAPEVYNFNAIVEAIGAPFAGISIIQQARNMIPHLSQAEALAIQQFILSFAALDATDQAELNRIYEADAAGDVGDALALQIIVISCGNANEARNYIKERVERRMLDQIQPFIDAIQNRQIQDLGPNGSTFEQRDAIRRFLDVLNPPQPVDGGLPPPALSSAQKEICLNALFRKLNEIIPAAAKVIEEHIQAFITAINIAPVICGQPDIMRNLTNNQPLQNCTRAILALPALQREIHYQELLIKLKAMVPVYEPRQGESVAAFQARLPELRNAFQAALTQKLDVIIRNRIDAITPPRELLSPIPRAPEPNGMVDAVDHGNYHHGHAVLAHDYADNLGAILPDNDIRDAPFNSHPPYAEDQNGRLRKSEADFESRLIRFLIDHWAAYYKPEISDDINTQPFRQALQAKFDVINNTYGINIVEKKSRKVALIENILYRLLACVQPPLPDELPQPPSLESALLDMGIPIVEMNREEHADIVDPVREQINDAKRQRLRILNPLLINPMVDIINGAVPENHVYTSMAAIRTLPSINWDEELNTHVFTPHPALRQQEGESDLVYWRRIGTALIQIYNAKIKSHVYPDDLQATLNANIDPQLIPFAMMFSDANDAGNAINYPAAEHGNAQEMVLAFDISAPNLQNPPHNMPIDIKQKLHDSYKKTHDFVINSIQKLFCLPIFDDLAEPLPWPFFSRAEPEQLRMNIEEFTQERKDLCKKLLLMFSYFNRDGDHFADDIQMLGTLIGRFTHCADGKKGAIESVSRIALKGFKDAVAAAAAEPGEEGEGLEIGEADLGTFLKQIILADFKNDTIIAVADHNHHESVSIITNIKFRHKDFWNVPTNSQAQYPNYTATDYAFNAAPPEEIDVILRYFYQHIYVGPHELVNKIHAYLRSVDAHKRENFLGLVCTMLARSRPFADWIEDGIDYRSLVKEHYCENIAVGGAEPDYIFTRKGIETILFYAGYLAWNGAPGAHPLIADWNANLAWLHDHYLDEYNAIYIH